MAKYESSIKMTPAPVEKVYQVLSNLESLKPFIDNAQAFVNGPNANPAIKEAMEKEGVDPSMLEKLKDVQITADRISAPVPMIGEFSMFIVEREAPSHSTGSGQGCIKFQTEKSPIEATLWIQVLPTHEMLTQMGDPGTKMRLTLKADMNPMIKMMVGSKLEKGIEKFADMLAMLPYNNM